jgi:hypothetical protein
LLAIAKNINTVPTAAVPSAAVQSAADAKIHRLDVNRSRGAEGSDARGAQRHQNFRQPDTPSATERSGAVGRERHALRGPNLQPGSELLFLTQHAAQELMDTDHGPSSRQAAENAYRTTIQRTESVLGADEPLDYLI